MADPVLFRRDGEMVPGEVVLPLVGQAGGGGPGGVGHPARHGRGPVRGQVLLALQPRVTAQYTPGQWPAWLPAGMARSRRADWVRLASSGTQHQWGGVASVRMGDR